MHNYRDDKQVYSCRRILCVATIIIALIIRLLYSNITARRRKRFYNRDIYLLEYITNIQCYHNPANPSGIR